MKVFFRICQGLKFLSVRGWPTNNVPEKAWRIAFSIRHQNGGKEERTGEVTNVDGEDKDGWIGICMDMGDLTPKIQSGEAEITGWRSVIPPPKT